jgi:peptidoglycan/LPS O-acetylase OafA/YrhL
LSDQASVREDSQRSADQIEAVAKPPNKSRESYGLVQELRGIAALWVVLFHASEGHHIDALKASIPAWTHPIFDLGNNGVAIFFALSGFVIAHSVRNDRINLGYVGRFALRRSIRLDPAYWASIAFFIAAAALSAAVKAEPFAPPSIGQVAANATYTQLFLGFPSINPVYWTLCYEVQFYLVLVLCIMAAQRLGPVVHVVPFAAAALWGCGLPNPVEGLFLDRWHCFFIGVLAYWGIKSTKSIAAFAALAVLLCFSAPTTFTIISMMTAAGLLIAGRTGFITRGVGWPPLLFLGTISYSLYLTHNPVTGAAFFVLAKAGIPEWAALFVSTAACIALAAAFWFAIERPTMKFAHRIKLRSEHDVESGFASLPATAA